MQHHAQRGQRLIGRDQHPAVGKVALVDDAVEHVRRIGGMRQIPELVNDPTCGCR